MTMIKTVYTIRGNTVENSLLNENIAKHNSKIITNPIIDSRYMIIEHKLHKIFENEVNKEEPAILRYNPEMISKAAMFLSGMIQRSASLGIAGETASGKSTVTYDIIETLELFSKEFEINNIVTRVNTDDYYYDRSEMVKAAGGMANFSKTYDFDVPEALELSLMKKHILQLLDGQSVLLPEYDMSGTTIRRDNVKPAHPAKMIISEGLFTLTDDIIDAFDFKLYVHVDHDIQKERFFIRANERGLGEGAESIYQNALNKAKIYIRPAFEIADIVIDGNVDRQKYKNFLNSILSMVQEVSL